jgi:transposase
MAVMTKAVAELPDDVDALKAIIVAMADQRALLEARNDHLEVVNKTADERIATLTAIVRMLERSRYGTRSERLRGATLSDEQHAFVFDEINTGMAAVEAELESTVQDKPKRAPRPRKGFAVHLERVEIVLEPEVPAGCEGLEKVLIGEDVSERLDVMPVKFRVIVTRRPKYAYRNRDGVIQASAPPHIIESGLPTEALGPDCGLQICRWSAALSAGSHLCAGPGRAGPFADGAVDGQGWLRTAASGRLCSGTDQAG